MGQRKTNKRFLAGRLQDKLNVPLGAVDGHLSDELVKALGVKLLSDWADARFPRLSQLQLLVQLLLQVDDVESRGGSGAHVLNPELTVLGPFPWGQDRVEDVLGLGHSRLLLHGRQVLLSSRLLLPLVLGRAHEHWGVVLHQRYKRRNHLAAVSLRARSLSLSLSLSLSRFGFSPTTEGTSRRKLQA